MANTPEKAPAATTTVVGDVAEVQFSIDDLIKNMATMVRSESCNGCNHCKAEADIETKSA